MASSEQRRHTRIRRRLPMLLEVRGRSISAITGDLSQSGVQVHCSEILQPGTPVSGTLNLDGSPLKFGAMVRWSRSASRLNSNETQHSMGLAFLSAPGAAYTDYYNRASAALGVSPAVESPSPVATKPVPARPVAKSFSGTTPLPRPGPRPPIVAPIAPPADRSPVPVPPVPLAPMPQQPAPSKALTPPPPSGLTIGLIGKVEETTKAAEAQPRGASPIAPSAAAVLFEQAAIQAVAAALPAGTQTLGLSLKLSLNRPPHVMIGARLEATATLVHIAPDRTLRFQVELREGERLVASGEHQRVLVSG